MTRLLNYFKDARNELNHVAWPTRQQALIYTALVVGISTIVAAFVGGVDYVLSQGVNWFIR